MRTSTNFIQPPQKAVTPVAIVLWLLSLGCLTGLWWLLGDAAGLRSDLPVLREQLAHLEATTRKESIPAPQLPPANELVKTRDRVARINAMTQTKGLLTLGLLSELETQLPQEAWLVSLHHRATEGEVTLVAVAASADTLSRFLHKLEHDPAFDKAMLLREVVAPNGKSGVQFEIRLKVHA